MRQQQQLAPSKREAMQRLRRLLTQLDAAHMEEQIRAHVEAVRLERVEAEWRKSEEEEE